MFEIDWNFLGDEVVRYGLIFGAIFQMICIGAAIFLPCKSDTEASSQRQSENLNDTFLLESEDSDVDGRVFQNTGQRQPHYRHAHHHHHHPHDDNHRASSTASSRTSKRHEKKKRR